MFLAVGDVCWTFWDANMDDLKQKIYEQKNSTKLKLPSSFITNNYLITFIGIQHHKTSIQCVI